MSKEINLHRHRFQSEGQPMTLPAIPLPIEEELPSLDGTTAWLNSHP
ncbi:hypothetical protein [Ktedonobacter robiniae]|nr:hypothetical protein [Ktedonobacter robiniae]